MTNAGVAAPARRSSTSARGRCPDSARDVRLLRRVRGGAHLGARGGRRAQHAARVEGREGACVAEQGVVEPGHGIARSSKSTGIPSSTG